ncbi:MAG: hypothetical protein ACRYFV_20450 [Janthinobacterium lividum]
MAQTSPPRKLAVTISYALGGLLLISLALALLPPLLPSSWHLFPPMPIIWLNALSSFGSFFGGMLAPVVAAISFYYLYQSYKAQENDREIALFNKLYTDLLADIASLRYRERSKRGLFYPEQEKIYEGIDALYNFSTRYTDNSVLNHLGLILISFEELVRQLGHYQSYEARKILLNKVYFLYYAKIVWPVFDGLYHYKDELLVRDWGNPKELFFEFEKLTKQTIDHLSSSDNRLLEDEALNQHPEISRIRKTNYSTDFRKNWILSACAAANAKYQIPSTPIPLRTKIGIVVRMVLPSRTAEWLRVNTLPIPSKSNKIAIEAWFKEQQQKEHRLH